MSFTPQTSPQQFRQKSHKKRLIYERLYDFKDIIKRKLFNANSQKA
jgi:hypothetical protein